MPLRALGYLTSATHIQREYLPSAQVQFVHTLHSGQRVNGVDFVHSRAAAEQFASLGASLLEANGIAISSVTFLTDPTEAAEIDEAAVAAVLSGMPAAVRDKLFASGTRRGSDVAPYVAAHLQMHDSTEQLIPLRCDDTPPVQARRVISVGAQSERPFYLARMACHAEGVTVPGRLDDTAQLFTRHVIPPYQFTNQGAEPVLSRITLADAASGIAAPAPENLSVARDLQYLQNAINHIERGAVYA